MVKRLLLIFVLLLSIQLYADKVPVNIQKQYNYLVERNNTLTNKEQNLGKWFLILKDGTVDDLKIFLNDLENSGSHLTYKSSILNLRAADATRINNYLAALNSDELLELYVAVDDADPIIVPIAPPYGSNTEEELRDHYSQYLKQTVNKDGYDIKEIEGSIASRFEHSSELISQYQNNLVSTKKYKILLIQSIAQYKFKNNRTQSSLITRYKSGGEWGDAQRNALKEDLKQDDNIYSSNSAVNALLKHSSNFYKVVYGYEPNAEIPSLQFDFDIEGMPLEGTITKITPNDVETLSSENVKIFDFAGIFTKEEYQNINKELQSLPLNSFSKVYVYYTDDSVSEEITEGINAISNEYNSVGLWFHLEEDNTFSTKLILSADVEKSYAFLKLWRNKTTFERLGYRGNDMLRDFGTGFAEFGTVLSDFIKKAKIPEDFYNKCAPGFEENYGRLHENINVWMTIDPRLVEFTNRTLRPFTEKFISAYLPQSCNYDYNTPADQLWIAIAFYSGVWNEADNLLAEIPESFSIINFLINPDIDTGKETVAFFNAIDPEEVMNLATTSLDEAFPSDNIYVVAHSSGRSTLFIASFAVAFTKVGKLSKLNTIVDAVDMTAVLFRTIGVGTKYTIRAVGKVTDGVFHLISKVNNVVVAKLTKLNTGLYRFAVLNTEDFVPIGLLDENEVLRIDKWVKEGEVLRTLEDVKYLDGTGVEKTGDLAILKNGEEVGGKISKEADDVLNELIAEIQAKFPDELTDDWDDFIADFRYNGELLEKFAKNPELVYSWEKLVNLGADDAIRKNLGALEVLDLKAKGQLNAIPDPSDYLDPDYIANHLAKFDEGAIRFTTKRPTLGTEEAFVIPKSEFDELMTKTGGDLSQIEKELALKEHTLTGDNAVIAWIKKEDFSDIRMPSGREKGADSNLWIPGGKTANGGWSEAVMDLSDPNIPKTLYPF